MKPTRIGPEGWSRKDFQVMTSSLRMDIRGCDGGDGIQALVVLRAVEVDSHGFAVGGEGMAVGAGVHAFEHHLAARFGDIAQPPGDQRYGRGAPAA